MGHTRIKAAPVAPDSIAIAAPALGKPNRPPTEYEKRVHAVSWHLSIQPLHVVPVHANVLFCVLQMCKAIPAGKVSTYGEMAKALSSSARAVGQVRCSADPPVTVLCSTACIRPCLSLSQPLTSITSLFSGCGLNPFPGNL